MSICPVFRSATGNAFTTPSHWDASYLINKRMGAIVKSGYFAKQHENRELMSHHSRPGISYNQDVKDRQLIKQKAQDGALALISPTTGKMSTGSGMRRHHRRGISKYR
jgi:hypothetical protein